MPRHWIIQCISTIPSGRISSCHSCLCPQKYMHYWFQFIWIDSSYTYCGSLNVLVYPAGGTLWGGLEARALLKEVCCWGGGGGDFVIKASCHVQFVSLLSKVWVLSFLPLLLPAMPAACSPDPYHDGFLSPWSYEPKYTLSSFKLHGHNVLMPATEM